MPRCVDGSWCVDDLCHMTARTLCGTDTTHDLDDEGEFRDEDDGAWEDDVPFDQVEA